MKIRIRNLGPVIQAEIAVRPLTIFVGPGNTGKTWTANAIANLLGLFGYGWLEYLNAFREQRTAETYPVIEATIEALSTKGHAQVDLLAFAQNYGVRYFGGIAKRAQDWLPAVIGAPGAHFQHTGLSIADGDDAETWHKVAELKIKDQVGGVLRALKEAGTTTLHFYTEGEASSLPPTTLREFVARNVFAALHRCLYTFVWPFPTERSGFFPQLEQTGQLLRGFPVYGSITQSYADLTENLKGTLITFPITIYQGWMTAALMTGTRVQREQQARQEPQINEYLRLAEILEHDLLGGQVDFSTPAPGIDRRIHFSIPGGTLGINAASSTVKELAPLVFYLRYLATEGDLVVIDEPEMNLHPEAQVRLVEFLGMMVNAGINVMATTHSPYVVDHLANLIAGARHPRPAEAAEHFFLKCEAALLSQAQVAVYLFENGTAHSILDAQGDIDWGTFGRVSDRISQIYFDVFDVVEAVE
ncbi:MAG TPA: AAA family ATPase [Anaerolineae bacterium]|mgnify:FL=1|nr:AAA family ATPase [Anaerolineae bacterium]